MTTLYRKKLIEVSLPLNAINDASAYDKMPGIGAHPKGIHHWWARLPLPTARAVLFSSLVDDPSEHPDRFPTEEAQKKERERLFGIIEKLLQKKIQNHPEAFELARAEILRNCDDNLPALLDPFAGGGSIPLEGQRLGLEVHASDLNPVAVLINKATLEIIPKYVDQLPINPKARNLIGHDSKWPNASGLADDVRYYGSWMLNEAKRQIGDLYPQVELPGESGGGKSNVVAWLWARTVRCPNPGCRAEIPLVRSFTLSTKEGRQFSIKPIISPGNPAEVSFNVVKGKPRIPGTIIKKHGAKCLCCSAPPITMEYISVEGTEGRIGTRLLAIVAERRTGKGKVYVTPTSEHESVADVTNIANVPDTDLPEKALGFRLQRYGMKKHRDLFAKRQLVAITKLSELIREAKVRLVLDGANSDYASAVSTFLSLALDRCVDYDNSFCTWSASNEKVMHLFGKQSVPMIWDYAEANILGEAVGGWITCCNYVADCIEVVCPRQAPSGTVYQLDASTAIRNGRNLLVSTDPPYYDNIGYADLADFFYVWLRRSLWDTYPDLFSTMLVPKKEELVATPFRFDGDKIAAKNHFENGFRQAFSLVRDKLDPRFPMTVYYAFKQSEDQEEVSELDDDGEPGESSHVTTGWETFLEALMSTGFQITGTWPIRASQKWRMVAMGSNALASYIVLACRVRDSQAEIVSRSQFLALLRRELPAALKKLQEGNIAPVDLAQVAIGPGMAIFSRFRQVAEANGNAMSVRVALQLINQTLDEVLAEQEGEFDGDTRWALAWFEQQGMEDGPFGVAETLSRAKNTAVNGLVEAGIIHARAGKVRLLKRHELPEDWDPASDTRLTIWEVVQHLIHTLEQKGEEDAAALVKRLGGTAETARDLAYRLYTICERKKWAQEALAYNGLVIAWPEITRLASGIKPLTEIEKTLFEQE